MTLKKVYTGFFFLGIFFIPFNSYSGISFLGEYKRESAILFFLVSLLLLLIESFHTGKIKLLKNSIFLQLFSVFIICILVSTFLNVTNVSTSVFKKTTGWVRFIKQVIALALAFSVFLLSLNVLLKGDYQKILNKIRKVFLYSLLFSCFYALFEYIALFKSYFTKTVYLFNYVPFVEVYLDHQFKRISSICLEPPFLAIYLITLSGWMFSYIITHKNSARFIPGLLVLILTILSGSRTALLVVFFQILVFVFVAYRFKRKTKIVFQNIAFILLFISIISVAFNYKSVTNTINNKLNSVSFIKNIENNVSNKSRFGIQYASLLVFKENPVFGVGFGQQAYHAKDKYPKWATQKNYEFKEYYLNENEPSFPPGFNMYIRLLAEVGIIGFLFFILFLGTILYQSYVLTKHVNKEKKVIAIILLISFVGYTINWLQFDSFRLFGFWICLAVLVTTVKKVHE